MARGHNAFVLSPIFFTLLNLGLLAFGLSFELGLLT
jgi:hypothetical protein